MKTKGEVQTQINIMEEELRQVKDHISDKEIRGLQDRSLFRTEGIIQAKLHVLRWFLEDK